MGQSVFPAPSAASKTRKAETLTSGTSWTVPTGVTYVVATLVGGGGGGGGSTDQNLTGGERGNPGAVVTSTVNTTPGASITYAIGAGGTAGTADTSGGTIGGTGGTTTFTGATSAVGGTGGRNFSGNGQVGTAAGLANNAGQGSGNYLKTGGAGGAGVIYLEYWV